MRLSSWFLLGGTAIAAGLMESAFAGSAPYPLSHIRPLLPGVVFLILLTRPQAGYVAAGLTGLIVDLIKADSSGFATARWLLIALTADYVYEKIMTNRSLSAAWILILLARILDYILLLLTHWLSPLILQKKIFIELWKDYLLIGFFDILIITLLFVGFTLFTKRFLISIPLTKDRYG